MAGLNDTIKFLSGEYRPCLVNGRKALFHRWEDKASIRDTIMAGTIPGQLAATVGIVEYEDGTVHECYPYEIRFCDSKFSEYCFDDRSIESR